MRSASSADGSSFRGSDIQTFRGIRDPREGTQKIVIIGQTARRRERAERGGKRGAITEISSFHDTGTFLLLPSPTSAQLRSTLYLPSVKLPRRAGVGIVWRRERIEGSPLPLDTLSLSTSLPPPSSPFPNADSLLFSKEQLKRLLHSRMIDDRGFQVALDARSVGQKTSRGGRIVTLFGLLRSRCILAAYHHRPF